MDGSIGVLHCEYVPGRQDPELVRELDVLGRTALAEALGPALDEVLGADRTVYVLSEIRSECVLDLTAPNVAERWAAELASDIGRAIREGDDTTVKRFADETDYLAGYLVEHVRGAADRHWYYRPLSRFHRYASSVLVATTLHGDRSRAVLAALHRQGSLPEVLAVLDQQALAAVMSPAPPVDDSFRDAVVGTAMRIADLCLLWTTSARPVLDLGLLRGAEANWRDPAVLTEAVLEVLRRLTDHGFVGRAGQTLPERARSELDWLDLPMIERWLADPATALVPATARTEQSVRGALVRLVTSPGRSAELVRRVGAAGPGAYSSILLTAALAADHPEWTDEPAVPAVLSDAMRAWRIDPLSGAGDDLARALATAADVAAVREVSSQVAGVLLLVRAVLDLRLPAVLARAGLEDCLPGVLLAVTMRLTESDPDDPAALVLAGLLPRDRPDHALKLLREMEVQRCESLREKLTASVEAHGLTLDTELAGRTLGTEPMDDVLGLVASAVLRAWSRWLNRFAASGAPYLARHFLCRHGLVRLTDDEVVVELTAGPLDVVLQLAGYDAPIETVPWLGNRRLVYRLGGR